MHITKTAILWKYLCSANNTRVFYKVFLCPNEALVPVMLEL